MTRTLTISTAAMLWASAALSATVSIDFEGGMNSGAVQNGAASGIWEEDGFIVSWDFYNDFLDETPTLEEFNDFTFLSDFDPGAGVGSYATEMTIEKADGGSFDLEGIGSVISYDGYALFAEFTPVGDDGEPDAAAVKEYVGPVLRPSLALTGTKTDGTVVVATALTGDVETVDKDPLFYPNFFGPSEAIISPETLDLMTDLASLKVEVDDTIFDEMSTALALVEFNAPAEIVAAAVACGGESCDIDGVGSLEIDTALVGLRNDTQAVEVAGITVSSDDLADVAPAPVPLPASAWMLVAGIGLLGAGRLARRR